MYANNTLTTTNYESQQAAALQDIINQTLYYLFPFCTEYFIQLIQRFANVQWYNYTEAQKMQLLQQFDNNRFVKFCFRAEEYIGLIKGAIFISKVLSAYALSIKEFFAYKSNDGDSAQKLAALLQSSGINILQINLAIYFLHDLVWLAFKKYQIRKIGNNVSISGNAQGNVRRSSVQVNDNYVANPIAMISMPRM